MYIGRVTTYHSPTSCKKPLKLSKFRFAWGFPYIFLPCAFNCFSNNFLSAVFFLCSALATY